MNICIFGAARDTIPEVYIKSIEELGEKMARRGHALVFGGGAAGIMGAAARGVQSMGGQLIGIAPRFFDKPGVLVPNCNEFIFTDGLHDRKEIMQDRSDGFIIAPGGVGTLDEFFQVYTLRTLGRHNKPVAVYNVNGYYDELLAFLKKAVAQTFLTPDQHACARIFTDADMLLDYMES